MRRVLKQLKHQTEFRKLRPWLREIVVSVSHYLVLGAPMPHSGSLLARAAGERYECVIRMRLTAEEHCKMLQAFQSQKQYQEVSAWLRHTILAGVQHQDNEWGGRLPVIYIAPNHEPPDKPSAVVSPSGTSWTARKDRGWEKQNLGSTQVRARRANRCRSGRHFMRGDNVMWSGKRKLCRACYEEHRRTST